MFTEIWLIIILYEDHTLKLKREIYHCYMTLLATDAIFHKEKLIMNLIWLVIWHQNYTLSPPSPAVVHVHTHKTNRAFSYNPVNKHGINLNLLIWFKPRNLLQLSKLVLKSYYTGKQIWPFLQRLSLKDELTGWVKANLATQYDNINCL